MLHAFTLILKVVPLAKDASGLLLHAYIALISGTSRIWRTARRMRTWTSIISPARNSTVPTR